MNDNTIEIKLDADNKELIGVSSVRLNALLRYGKIMEEYMKKSQTDIQALDISEKVNSKIASKIDDVESLMTNKLGSGISSKLDSVNSLITEKLSHINSQLDTNIRSKISDINSVLTKTDIFIQKTHDILVNNNQCSDKTNQSLTLINSNLIKEIANIKSELNDIISKNNSKDGISNLNTNFILYINNLKTELKEMLNNNTNKDLFNSLINEHKKDFATLRLEINDMLGKSNARDMIELLKSDVKSNINGIKDQIAETIKKNLEEKGIIRQIDAIKSYIDESMGKSSKKGIILENKVANMLKKFEADYEIKDSRHEAKQSDFQLTNEKYKILVEVKNYSRNLPTSELNKFKNNIQTVVCDGGIIINNKFGFANFDSKCIEIIDVNEKPVILLSEFKNSTVKLKMALKLLELAIDIKRKTVENKNNNKALELEHQLTKSNILLKEIDDKRKKSRVIIENFYTQQITVINQFKDQILPLLIN